MPNPDCPRRAEIGAVALVHAWYRALVKRQGQMFAVPENWEEMTEEEQDAWVEAVLIAMQKQPDN